MGQLRVCETEYKYTDRAKGHAAKQQLISNIVLAYCLCSVIILLNLCNKYTVHSTPQ